MMTDIFVMSLDAMKSYKVRTFLTLIGIVIGIASVIMVTSAGDSVSGFIAEQWNIFNPTGMIVGTGTGGDAPQLSLRSIVFTTNDVENMGTLPHVKYIAPVGIVPIKKLWLREGFLQWDTNPGETMYATTPELMEILNLELESGDMFQEGKNEIVISKSLSETFGEGKILNIGDTIYVQRIDGSKLKAEIVGILKDTGTSTMFNQMASPSILCPVKPYYSSYIGSNVGTVFKRVTAFTFLLAEAKDIKHVEDAKNEILDYLDGQSDANDYKDKKSDFVVITQQYILVRIEQVMSVIRTYITAIALISLLIGGIGIANIMFATVTERTREIGTMMAIGAKRRDILLLFLYQSTIVGLLGGIVGVILGASGSVVVINLLNQNIKTLGGAFSTGSIPVSYSMEWFIIATVVGILIGVAAGLIPARKAAKMDPVEALRYE